MMNKSRSWVAVLAAVVVVAAVALTVSQYGQGPTVLAETDAQKMWR
jgi:hypothetical protein